MIIDAHAHVASQAMLPERFFEGWIGTLTRSLPLRPSPAQEERLRGLFMQMREDPGCERLLAEMDEAGIGRTVLLVLDFGLAFEDLGWDIEAVHLAHRRILEKSGRFIAFAGVDPRRGKAGLALFEKAVGEWGFSGLKVYPPCGFSPSDESLYPYYETCAQLGLPVLVHIGPSSSSMAFRFSQPMEMDKAAQAFPKVNFILGHAASLPLPEAMLMAQYRPNIYLDLSGFQQESSGLSLAHLIQGHLSRRLEKRLLFGTDWPIHRFFGSQARWVGEFRKLEAQGLLSPGQLEDILGNNAAQIIPSRRSLCPDPR